MSSTSKCRLKSVSFSTLAALALSVSSTALTATAQAQTPRTGGSDAILNYEGANLSAVARDVALRTGRVFVIDPRLQGKVNIVSPPGVTLSPDQVWDVFLATLQVNGFAAVPIGDREYKIIPSGQAVREGDSNAVGGRGTTVTRVVPLRFVAAPTAAANLRGLLSENGLVTPIVESNALIVVDTGANVRRILSVVDSIDVDNSVVRTIPLQNAAASAVASALSGIVKTGENRVGGLSVAPFDSTNSIVLRGDAKEVERVIPIIRQLDVAGSSQMSLDTIYLSHADGEAIVEILETLLGEDSGPAPAEGAPNRPVGRRTIAFHKPTNAIVVNAPPEQQRLIRNVISRLDIRRPMVMIETVVVEISNTAARELGVQYLTGGDDIPLSAASFNNTSPNIASAAGAALFLGDAANSDRTVTVVNPDGSVTSTTESAFDANDPATAVAGQLLDAAISDLLNLNGFALGAGGRSSDGSVYAVLLNAIKSDNESNVLSVPSVVLLDNQTATLQVGQEIPIVTGEAVGSDFQGGFRQIERRDVGNILEVTPQINEGNTVQLTIKLEVSSIGAFTALTQDIITNKSMIETVALAEDGQTLVIGGLIDNNSRNGENKVPILGDVPLLGNLFKGQNKSQEEKTLMMFIRPTLIRDGFDADAVTARKYDYVRQQQLKRDGNKDGTGEARIDEIMRDYIGPAGDTGSNF